MHFLFYVKLSINLFFVSSEGFGKGGFPNSIGRRNRILPSKSGDFSGLSGPLYEKSSLCSLEKYQTAKIAIGKICGRVSLLDTL